MANYTKLKQEVVNEQSKGMSLPTVVVVNSGITQSQNSIVGNEMMTNEMGDSQVSESKNDAAQVHAIPPATNYPGQSGASNDYPHGNYNHTNSTLPKPQTENLLTNNNINNLAGNFDRENAKALIELYLQRMHSYSLFLKGASASAVASQSQLSVKSESSAACSNKDSENSVMKHNPQMPPLLLDQPHPFVVYPTSAACSAVSANGQEQVPEKSTIINYTQGTNRRKSTLIIPNKSDLNHGAMEKGNSESLQRANDLSVPQIATALASPPKQIQEQNSNHDNNCTIPQDNSALEEGTNKDASINQTALHVSLFVSSPNMANIIGKIVEGNLAKSKTATPSSGKPGWFQDRVKCSFCKNTFKNEARLNTHMFKFHADAVSDILNQYTGSQSQTPDDQVLSKEKQKRKHSLALDRIELPQVNQLQPQKVIVNEGEIGDYSCPVCEKKLETKSILLLHINSRHVLDRLRICLECVKLFENQELLEDHIKSEHADSGIYSRMFGKKPKATSSVTKYTDENKKSKTVTKIPPTLHYQKVPSETSEALVFQCLKCSEIFDTEEKIQVHFTTSAACVPPTSSSKEVTCPICRKVLKTSLSEHMRTHSGDRPYECRVCFTRFKRGHQLKMHMQSLHSDEAKFQCEICDRKFKRKDKLACHYRSHTDDHPYMCTECGNVFKWKHHVKRHMLTVHQKMKRKESMRRHPCYICGKSFTWGHHLKRHLRNVHQVDTSDMGKLNNSYPATESTLMTDAGSMQMDTENEQTGEVSSFPNEDYSGSDLSDDGDSDCGETSHSKLVDTSPSTQNNPSPSWQTSASMQGDVSPSAVVMTSTVGIAKTSSSVQGDVSPSVVVMTSTVGIAKTSSSVQGDVSPSAVVMTSTVGLAKTSVQVKTQLSKEVKTSFSVQVESLPSRQTETSALSEVETSPLRSGKTSSSGSGETLTLRPAETSSDEVENSKCGAQPTENSKRGPTETLPSGSVKNFPQFQIPIAQPDQSSPAHEITPNVKNEKDGIVD